MSGAILARFHQDLLRHQVFHNGDGEQWVALGVVVDKFAQARRQYGLVQLFHDEAGNRRLWERLKRDLSAMFMHQHVVLESSQRVPGCDTARPKCDKDKKMGRGTTASERGEQVQCVHIGPMKVLEHQHQRLFARDLFKSGAKVAGHASLRRRLGSSGFRSLRLAADMGQPGRRHACQDAADLRGGSAGA